MIKHIYIHIPFCNNICSYCDFPKIYYNNNQVDKYLNILDQEIKDNYKGEPISTIYIGGGTPSSLSTKQLKKLFSITNNIKCANNLEFTIECNEDSLTKEKLDLFKQNKVNRISIGVQSIDEDKLKLMERTLSKNNLLNLISYSKKIGITNINCDLIFATPNDTINKLTKDLNFIISLDVPHISIYSLILEPHTKLHINKIKPLDEDLDHKLYNTICKTLKNYNYTHYEISNFSKTNFESNHNIAYWNNEQYYGFGLGASGYIDNIRYTNTKSINKYLNNKIDKDIETLTDEDKIEYEIITNLRKIEGISKNIFFNKYETSINKLFNYKHLIEKEYILENNNNIYINNKYLYVSNEIINMFLESREVNEK